MATSDPATFADMLSREQSAEAAMILGDPEPYKALWSRGEDMSLFGAFGPCKKGWHQLGKTFDWVASRYREGVVTAEYEVVHEGADLAYTVGYEIDDVVLDGATILARGYGSRRSTAGRTASGAWFTATATSPRLTRARQDRNGTGHAVWRCAARPRSAGALAASSYLAYSRSREAVTCQNPPFAYRTRVRVSGR